MSVEITSRVLPGIGVCQELDLHAGRRLGVVTRRNGSRDLVIYDDEGEGASASVELTDDEADAVAEILGAAKITARLAALQAHAEGLLVEQLPIPHDSPYAGRPLGETQARTRTGASIVAVLRDGRALTSPAPDFVLRGGDLVVTVGEREAVDHVARILTGPAPTPTAAPPSAPPSAPTAPTSARGHDAPPGSPVERG